MINEIDAEIKRLREENKRLLTWLHNIAAAEQWLQGEPMWMSEEKAKQHAQDGNLLSSWAKYAIEEGGS